jgi:hypothetical protein
MHRRIAHIFSLFSGQASLSLVAAHHTRQRRTARPRLETLELRVNLSTFIWTALGDGQTWNDASNWEQLGQVGPINQPTVPTPYSNVIFPPVDTLPVKTSNTINFNFAYLYMPLNSLTIEDPYTFTGNPLTIESSLSVANSFSSTPGATPAIIELSGLRLAPGVVISTATGSTLQLGNATAPTALQLDVQGAVTKSGGGQLVVDTQSVSYSNFSTVVPIPLTIASGSIELGDTVNLSGFNVQINSTAELLIADDVASSVQGLTGTGLVNLDGTTNAGDTTALTVAVPNATTDQFDGFIDGIGQFIAGGNGTLSTGTIDFDGARSIQVNAGTLDVNGSISADSLDVSGIATLGGLGLWNFSGPAVFQSGSTFDVTLNGTTPGTQYTQLVDTDATAGVNLGFAALAASVGYEYEQGDQYTIVSAPVIQGVFQNVVAGRVVVDVTVPMGVTPTSTSITMTPLQSVTTTGLASSTKRSNPGLPVTLTASVSTRTAPVSVGSVSFVQGSTVLGTVAAGSAGTASLTITSLPLGSSTITAIYSGAAPIIGSTSQTLSVSVVPYTTVTTVAGSPNPSTVGRPVTFTASVVTSAGTVATSGVISFRQGNRLLGTAALNAQGTASITISSLSIGKSGIQAIFSGTVDDLGSVSPVFKQTVGTSPTVTTLSITAQPLANGRSKFILVAIVTPDGNPALTPTGTVVFRRNGRSLGSARLKGGVARLVIGRKAPGSGAKFVASFQKNARSGASRSAPVVYLT